MCTNHSLFPKLFLLLFCYHWCSFLHNPYSKASQHSQLLIDPADFSSLGIGHSFCQWCWVQLYPDSPWGAAGCLPLGHSKTLDSSSCRPEGHWISIFQPVVKAFTAQLVARFVLFGWNPFSRDFRSSICSGIANRLVDAGFFCLEGSICSARADVVCSDWNSWWQRGGGWCKIWALHAGRSYSMTACRAYVFVYMVLNVSDSSTQNSLTKWTTKVHSCFSKKHADPIVKHVHGVCCIKQVLWTYWNCLASFTWPLFEQLYSIHRDILWGRRCTKTEHLGQLVLL